MPAVKRHRKAGDPADGPRGKPHHGVGVRIDSLNAERRNHRIAMQRIELVLGLALFYQHRGAAYAHLVDQAVRDPADAGGYPSAITYRLRGVQLLADAAGSDRR